MTKRLYLHVGGPKSGTTYLQSVLKANRARLAESGVAVIGERGGDLVRSGLLIREDPRVETMQPVEAFAWQRLVEQIRGWDGPSAVLSYELLAGASTEQVHEVLSRFPDVEVHVVITARDLARVVPSAWQEQLKFAGTSPLGSWRPRGESEGPQAEWGWRTMDPAGVAARWGVDLPPDRVHIVTVPRTRLEPEALWARFARACGLVDVDVDVEVTSANESLSPAAAEVLRRVNELVAEPLLSNREQKRWLRNVLAHQVLVPLGDETLGMTDEQFADALAVSERAIAAIKERGYDVQGDLDELRATRPAGRTPEELPDSEIADLAVRALYSLLLVLRVEAPGAGKPRSRGRWTSSEQATPVGPAGTVEPVASTRGPGARGRRLVRRVLERAGRPIERQRVAELEQRVAELDAHVGRARVLHRRVAELDDLVCELLLPAASQDDGVLLAALRRYRKDSL